MKMTRLFGDTRSLSADEGKRFIAIVVGIDEYHRVHCLICRRLSNVNRTMQKANMRTAKSCEIQNSRQR